MTNGRELLSARAAAGAPGELVAGEWDIGPAGPVCGWEPALAERQRQGGLALLTPAQVLVLSPAHVAAHDAPALAERRLLRLLAAPQQTPEGVGDALRAMASGGAHNGEQLSTEWLVLEAVRLEVVEAPLPPAPAGGADKEFFKRYVEGKDRAANEYRTALLSVSAPSIPTERRVSWILRSLGS